MWIRWQDLVTIASGAALILAPWIFGARSSTAFTIDAWFVGVLAIAAAFVSLSQARRLATAWITLLLGIWLFLSPWALSFLTMSTATITAWMIGLLLVVTAGPAPRENRRLQAGVPT